VELFTDYNDQAVKKRYRNWILIFTIPVALLLLIEFYLNWAYPKDSKAIYIKYMFVFVGVLLVLAFVALLINYWQYRRSIKDKVVRNIHLVFSIILLCALVITFKVAMFGLFTTEELYEIVYKRIGIRFKDNTWESIGIISDWVIILFLGLQTVFLIYIICKIAVRKIKERRNKFNGERKKIYQP
jgi:hypothetical protein